jgi:hypothetical protein
MGQSLRSCEHLLIADFQDPRDFELSLDLEIGAARDSQELAKLSGRESPWPSAILLGTETAERLS